MVALYVTITSSSQVGCVIFPLPISVKNILHLGFLRWRLCCLREASSRINVFFPSYRRYGGKQQSQSITQPVRLLMKRFIVNKLKAAYWRVQLVYTAEGDKRFAICTDLDDARLIADD